MGARTLANVTTPRTTITGVVRRARDTAKGLAGFIRLEDVTEADAPARIVGTATVAMRAGAQTATFELALRETLDPSRDYAFAAELRADDNEPFGTVAAHRWPQDTGLTNVVIEITKW